MANSAKYRSGAVRSRVDLFILDIQYRQSELAHVSQACTGGSRVVGGARDPLDPEELAAAVGPGAGLR